MVVAFPPKTKDPPAFCQFQPMYPAIALMIFCSTIAISPAAVSQSILGLYKEVRVTPATVLRRGGDTTLYIVRGECHLGTPLNEAAIISDNFFSDKPC